ncbi:MAG: hypothetical protein FJ125_07130 [Deltaproteobacteria bacterium]|nr:hypothetical protein [Deltaproteobacteria bacterium]
MAAILRDLPRPLRVAERCSVLTRLVEKARDLGHLDPAEQRSLIELLGHAPVQGREALLRILERGGLREQRELDRQLATLPPQPISCSRLRERYRQLLGGQECRCSFPGLRGRATRRRCCTPSAPRR